MSGHGGRRRTLAALVGIGVAVAGSAGLALADPPADFAASTDRPVPGEPVTFTAQAACGAPVECTWDFGDGDDGAGREVAHAFDAAGAYSVTLTVSDPGDPAGASTVTGAIRVDARPTAAFSVSPASPRKGDTVTFDGRASSDPDGDALGYRWDFDGDGVLDAEGAEITHSFATAGSHQVTLTVDDGRLEHSAFATVAVASLPPTAAIMPSSGTPLTGQSVTFTAMGTDPDGDIVAWAWDLDDDGEHDDAAGPAASATFATPGSRAVGVRVTDDDGETATARLSITVLNRDPVAAFTFSPDPAPQERPVTFTSQSTDPEGRLATEDWDLDGDGAYDDAAGPTASVTFSSAAARTIGLRVTDADGGAAEKQLVVLPGNETPQAGFAITPERPLSGETVTFNATAQDADGTIAGYAWDLDGDGAFDDGTEATAESAYPIPGSRRVRLRVVDDDGGSATAQKTFTVVNRPPVASFAVPTVMKQQPVVFTSSSTDPEGRLRSLAWDLDGDGEFDDGRAPSVTCVFPTTAKVTVSLRVVDADGGRDTYMVDVIPGNRPPTAAIAPSSESPLTGEPVRFTATAGDDDGGVAQLEWDLGAGFATGQAVAETAYAVPGQYPVRLRVTDTDGAATIAERTVHIGNRPPVAGFTYAPSLVVKGRPVTFTSEAEDPEGRMAAIEWDLDGDGAFDDATGDVASAAFTVARRTAVGLRARDRDGGEDEIRLTLVPGNRAPSAAFTAAPAANGLGATFTATAGDEDGSVTRVEWDFDDDGGFDDAVGDVAFWTFPRAGTYRVSLRVTDDDGSSAITVRRLAVPATGASGGGSGSGGTGAPPAPGGTPRPPAAGPALLDPWPVVRMAGTLTARGARLRVLSVRAPRGARVTASCLGRHCPRRALTRRMRKTATVRLGAFERPLRAGTVLVIRVASATRIGKHTRIAIRRGKAPARRDRCLWPGRTTPRGCPG